MTASAATWSRYAGFFVPEDAWVGMLAQLRAHATRGSAPSAALSALRTEPPLRAIASAAEITSLPCCITAENASLEQPRRSHVLNS